MRKTNREVKRLHRRADLSILRQIMPPFISRNHPKFREWTGFSPRSFANMDSLKETNTIQKIQLGKCVHYERETLVDWLEERSSVIE